MLSFATAVYWTLFAGTLCVHFIFMCYVLGGTGYLFYRSVMRSADPQLMELDNLLRDWMPFAISGAITAGVAPLLFIQILFRDNFYTANLLLFNRWMLILPVLVLGFYLSYAIKRTVRSPMRGWKDRLVCGSAYACFLTVAYLWAINHEVSLQESQWPEIYMSDSYHIKPALICRVGAWASASVAVMCAILSWQWRRTRSQSTGADLVIHHLSKTTSVCVVVAVILCASRGFQVDGLAERVFSSSIGQVTMLAGTLGVLLLLVGWESHKRSHCFTRFRERVCLGRNFIVHSGSNSTT